MSNLGDMECRIGEPVGGTRLRTLSSMICCLMSSIVPCLVRTAYTQRVSRKPIYLLGVGAKAPSYPTTNPMFTYHHQTCEFFIPAWALIHGCSVLGMTRDEVDGDFRCAKIVNVRLVLLIEIKKAPRLINSLPGLSQQIAYLRCATLADRESHVYARSA